MRALAATLIVLAGATAAFADPLNCDLTQYRAMPGLSASVADNVLSVTWQGDAGTELRARFAIEGGTPHIRELATRRSGGQWIAVLTNATPEYRVVSGVRRMTEQQLEPLEKLKVAITPDILERDKWNAFWDAPLFLEGSGVRPPTHSTSIPPMAGILDQPGLPRKPAEVQR